MRLFDWEVHERKIMKYFENMKFGVAIDVGASDGIWTNFLAERSQEVYAFEPNPRAFEILKENTKHLGNVILYRMALGSKMEKAFIFYKKDMVHTTCLDNMHMNLETEKCEQIDVNTIDNLFSNLKVDFIKIDTEGYEVEILHGAKNTLKKYKPCLCVETHGRHNFLACLYIIHELYRERVCNEKVLVKRIICDSYGDNDYILVV